MHSRLLPTRFSTSLVFPGEASETKAPAHSVYLRSGDEVWARKELGQGHIASEQIKPRPLGGQAPDSSHLPIHFWKIISGSFFICLFSHSYLLFFLCIPLSIFFHSLLQSFLSLSLFLYPYLSLSSLSLFLLVCFSPCLHFLAPPAPPPLSSTSHSLLSHPSSLYLLCRLTRPFPTLAPCPHSPDNPEGPGPSGKLPPQHLPPHTHTSSRPSRPRPLLYLQPP